jgi:uncharacterized protein (TIGR03086 family)
MDEIAALERAFDHTGAYVSKLTSAQRHDPTPCPGWDVDALLDHLLGVTAMFTDARNGRPLPEALPVGLAGDDPAAAYAAVVRDGLAAWRQPGALDEECATPLGPLPGAAAALLVVMEVAAHGVDLARALRLDAEVDAEVAEVLLPFVAGLPLDAIREAGEFGPAPSVPDVAPASTRLLALLGR